MTTTKHFTKLLKRGHLIYYNRLPKGTHFAAWKQPEFFVSELRASFKSLR
jgi:hypothetical protein